MSKFRRGFSLAETLTALGIIGILCITMLSLNSMSDNKYKVATTKLSQVDTALKSWGKAISESNETGLGAARVITSQPALSDSLSDYFNNLSTKTLSTDLKTSTNEAYTGSTGENAAKSGEILLNNGVKITFVYNGANANALNNANYTKDENSSPLAVVTAEIEDLPNTKEEYVVKSDGLHDLDSIYEGYTETKVETITVKDENGEEITKRVYCTNSSCSSENGGCQKNPSACLDAPGKGDTVYVDDNGAQTVSCGYNQTGAIKTVKIADAYGVYTTTINTCCNAPKICSAAECGDKNTSSCSCNSFVASAGYIKANNESCQKPADEGSYSKGGNVEKATLCGMGDEYAPKEEGETRKGYFCPNKGMTDSIICPKGSYCPDYADNTNKNKNEMYHPGVYANEEKLTGGLTKSVICPAGHYCPDEGMKKATPCPKGSYCPNEGMTEAINCPKGTYGDKGGATSKEKACKPCPAGNYCPNEGMTDTDLANFICNKDEGKYSLEGAIACSVCPAGQYLDKKEKICKPCSAGKYSDKAGATKCTLCPEGRYQNQEGQLSCMLCPNGTTPNDARTDCIKQCPENSKWVPDGNNSAGGYCLSNQKAYVIASYPVAKPSWQNQYSTLTVEDMIKDFALVADCATYACKDSGNPDRTYRDSSKYTGFSGSWYHNTDKSNDSAWMNLLSKLTAEDKAKTFYGGTAYVFLEDGTLLSTTSSKQVASTCWNASITASADPKLELVSSLGIEASHKSNYGEEGSGGQIKYDDIVYNVKYTIFRKQTPLVLDLKGNGLKFTDVHNGVSFDLDGDGSKEKTSWTDTQNEFDDAFLVYDKNENGIVDNGKELFGTQNGAENGFAELAKYDENGDGVVNEKDPAFLNLKLWCDMNKNGLTDEGELKTLKDLRVTELSTSVKEFYDETGKLLEDEQGNTTGIVGSFKMLVEKIVNGVKNLVETVRTMIDVLFNTISS